MVAVTLFTVHLPDLRSFWTEIQTKMKLFGITPRESFKEYIETDFQVKYSESILENWLEKNPHSIIEDGSLLIIGRQIVTNLGGFIDLLALDKRGDVAVIELKRNRTPRDTIAQALEYASFVEQLDYEQLEDIFRTYVGDESANLVQYHKEYFALSADDAAVFNKDQRIIIVGQKITPEIRQTATFLRQKDVRVTCVEFTFFETEEKLRLLSSEIVVGREPGKPSRIASGSQKRVSEKEFMGSLDQYGKSVFAKLLQFAKTNNLPIHWGTKGFSLNVDFGGVHVVVCFGYPPHSVFKQSIYTALLGRGGLLSKIDASDDLPQRILSDAANTGLFQPAGNELKCLINRPFSANEIEALLSWCQSAVNLIQAHGLKE
jgi:hypothetical protein